MFLFYSKNEHKINKRIHKEGAVGRNMSRAGVCLWCFAPQRAAGAGARWKWVEAWLLQHDKEIPFFCPGFMSTWRSKLVKQREKHGKKQLTSRHLGFIRHCAKSKFPHWVKTGLMSLSLGLDAITAVASACRWLCQYCSLEPLDSCAPPTLGRAPAGSFGWLSASPKCPLQGFASFQWKKGRIMAELDLKRSLDPQVQHPATHNYLPFV